MINNKVIYILGFLILLSSLSAQKESKDRLFGKDLIKTINQFHLEFIITSSISQIRL